jgi:hypothetical protein
MSKMNILMASIDGQRGKENYQTTSPVCCFCLTWKYCNTPKKMNNAGFGENE